MQKHARLFIDTVSRPGNVVLLLVAFAAMFAWMELPGLPYSAADFSAHLNGVPSLDMTIGYSPDKAFQMMGDYGPDGRVYYVQKLLINDIAFPVAYSLCFAAVLALLLTYLAGPDSRLRYLALLPLAGGAGDLLENAGILAMLLQYPARADWIATMTSMVTAVKLSVNAVAMTLILGSLVASAYRLLKNRAGPSNARL